MGLMVLASELFMMMINVCVQGGGGCQGTRLYVRLCVYDDDDEWRAPSPHTPNVYCVQTLRNYSSRHTVM